VNKNPFARWRGNFLTGLAVLLPTVVTLAIIKWLFGTIASFTDWLLFFLPTSWTHDPVSARMYWYWSLAAFLLAVVLVSLVGWLTRYYIGKQMVAWLDGVMFRVPLLNKIYGAIKQINDSFGTSSRHSFKTVVRVEFPSQGMYSIGFITSEAHDEVRARSGEKIVSVFIPTTPMPTAGFLILVPEEKVTKLDMSVAEAIKYIVSLGAIAPEALPVEAPAKRLKAETP
jgi:uncharacterized membrane protein